MWNVFFSTVLMLGATARGTAVPPRDDSISHARREAASADIAARLRSMPVTWIENRGQWDTAARFLARLPGGLARADHDGISIQVDGGEADAPMRSVVRLVFEGASPQVSIEGVDRQVGTYNIFRGNDSTRWVLDAGTFGAVRYGGLYPGIDLVLRSEGGRLKYDLFVAPMADLSKVMVRCEGVGSLSTDANGSLIMETPAGSITHAAGRSWEIMPSGEERETTCCFRVSSESSFGFEVRGRDPRHPLVIDPDLVWSTYLGSSGPTGVGDRAWAVATDPQSQSVTVVGFTDWDDFPSTPGAYQHVGIATGPGDTFVTRFRARDGALIYSCIIGGQHHQEKATAVAVDDLGRATVAGWTFSTDFPTTPGAFDTHKVSIGSSAFVLRLSPSGSDLEYSTFLEGTTLASDAEAYGLAVERSSGTATVGGWADANFPTTPGAFDNTINGGPDGFVTKLDPSGSSLVWSTTFGGSGQDFIYGLTQDEFGRVTVVGDTLSADLPITPGGFRSTDPVQVNADAFVTRFSSDGSSLEWSTYLGGTTGGSTGNYADIGRAIAGTRDGGVIVAGLTHDADFRVTPGAYQTTISYPPDGYVTRFGPDGALVYSTYLGGTGWDLLNGIRADSSGLATVTGGAWNQFPTTPGAYDTTWSGVVDVIVARLDPQGSKLLYSTLIGGPGGDGVQGIDVTPSGRVTVVGGCEGYYPTTPDSYSPNYNGGQGDAFVTMLDLLHEGTSLEGQSIPSCLGPVQINAAMMPQAGDPTFFLYCSGAPPLATGALLFRRDGPSTQVPWAAFAIPVVADAAGYLETHLPLPLGSSGTTWTVRYVFPSTPTCQGPAARCASPLLRFTIQ